MPAEITDVENTGQAAEPNIRMETFANLSTGHLTKEVAAVLDKDQYEPWFDQINLMSREYGWFIYVPPQYDDGNKEAYASIPECLRACFDLARTEGAIWILFDCDEEPIEALPFYEW